jgi:hypothetical protein
MSMGVISETIIANGVVPPIRMIPFPSMEKHQPVWRKVHPDIARSQIEIHATNETDVFKTIPDVSVRNHYWRIYHRCRSRNYQWLERYLPIWLNDTA